MTGLALSVAQRQSLNLLVKDLLLLLVQDVLLLGVLEEALILLGSILLLELLTLLLELPNEAAVLKMSLEGLDGSGAVRKASDRGEALHGEV